MFSEAPANNQASLRNLIAMLKPSRNNILFVATIMLTVLGGIFLIDGLRTLTAPTFGGDLLMRWREQQLVLSGINPYDVSANSLDLPTTPSETERLKNLKEAPIESIMSSGYPPWSFVAGRLFVYSGNFRITQYVFAALNVLALALTLTWTYLLARQHGKLAGFFLAASVLAMFGHASTLRLGQYGIICNALMIMMLVAEERHKEVPAGIAFALASIKPNLSGLYFLILVVRRRIIAIAVASAFLLTASFLVGYLVKTSPVEMMQQMIRQSSVVFAGGIGPLNVMLDYHVPFSVATNGLALSGLIASFLLMIRWRSSATITLFSIGAVIGRLAVYHRQYDNVMLVFPLVALGLNMFQKPTPWRIGSFAIFGCSLWIPFRYRDYTPPVELALAAIWIFGLCVILASSSSIEKRAPQPY
jgi:hypothetical protein